MRPPLVPGATELGTPSLGSKGERCHHGSHLIHHHSDTRLHSKSSLTVEGVSGGAFLYSINASFSFPPSSSFSLALPSSLFPSSIKFSSAKANGTATMCLPLRLQGLAKGLASRGSQSGLRGGKMVTWRGPLCMVREGPAGAESTEHQRGESEPCWGWGRGWRD